MVLICSCASSGKLIDVNIYGLEKKIQCKACNNNGCNGCHDIIRQKLMWKQVRVPSSQLTSVKQAINVLGGESNSPTIENGNVNWNQSSDRSNASIQKVYRSTHGNSTKMSITRERPGSQSPGGVGVDIKHNSYNRYLARKKAPHLKTEMLESVPVQGNKTRSYGLVMC